MRLTIDFNIGPLKNNQTKQGQYIYIAPDASPEETEKHINDALKKSIQKLDCDKSKLLVGIFDIFINEQPYLKMSFFKIGSLFKSYTKKIS